MPDRYWCTACDVGFTSVADGSCPHCGAGLQDMEGFEGSSDDSAEYSDKDLEDGEETELENKGSGFDDGNMVKDNVI